MPERLRSGRQLDNTRHHVVIAGTGRAGTSFLVKFLGSCGLDVGDTGLWIDNARAGLEHNLLDEDSPYVVKDPWLFNYLHEVDMTSITVDALIVPIRDLFAAATSRVFQERLDMANGEESLRPISDVRGGADAGIVYSLDPTDQARLLAVGFHRLIHWATVEEIPLFLLDFPRAVSDRDYLIETLWPVLCTHCTNRQAQGAFAATAEPALLRIGTPPASTNVSFGMADDERELTAARLDRDAMATALGRCNTLLAATKARLVGAEARSAEQEKELHRALDRSGQALQLLDTARRDLDGAQTEVDALRRTVSWRVTRPLRTIRRLAAQPEHRLSGPRKRRGAGRRPDWGEENPAHWRRRLT
jgi:hypothetical protein